VVAYRGDADEADDGPDEVSDAAATRLADAAEPDPTGRAALAQALLLFEGTLRLPFPPVPEALAEQVRILAPGAIGTRDPPPDLATSQAFLADLTGGGTSTPAASYIVAACHEPGLGRRTVLYALVLDPVALYLRLPIASVYAPDQDSMRARIDHAFGLCADLIATVTDPGQMSPTPRGERLIAIDAPPDERCLGRLIPGQPPVLEPSDDPLAELLAILGRA
jgi:hypothetical protein